MFKELLEANRYRDIIEKNRLEWLTGGVLKWHTLSSYKRKRNVPMPESWRHGGRTAYRVTDIIAWLETNCTKDV